MRPTTSKGTAQNAHFEDGLLILSTGGNLDLFLQLHNGLENSRRLLLQRSFIRGRCRRGCSSLRLRHRNNQGNHNQLEDRGIPSGYEAIKAARLLLLRPSRKQTRTDCTSSGASAETTDRGTGGVSSTPTGARWYPAAGGTQALSVKRYEGFENKPPHRAGSTISPHKVVPSFHNPRECSDVIGSKQVLSFPRHQRRAEHQASACTARAHISPDTTPAEDVTPRTAPHAPCTRVGVACGRTTLNISTRQHAQPVAPSPRRQRTPAPSLHSQTWSQHAASTSDRVIHTSPDDSSGWLSLVCILRPPSGSSRLAPPAATACTPVSPAANRPSTMRPMRASNRA